MSSALSAEVVLWMHERIIARYGGLGGFSQGGEGALESALQRIENHRLYNDISNPFEIAALYAEAIARGHVFNDGNKRTALACTLTFLHQQGIGIPQTPALEQITVDLATGSKGYLWFAQFLAALAQPFCSD